MLSMVEVRRTGFPSNHIAQLQIFCYSEFHIEESMKWSSKYHIRSESAANDESCAVPMC